MKNIIISIKYLDFTNIFKFKSIIKLLKYISINNYSIERVNNKQLFYS